MPALGGWRRFVSKASLSYTAAPCLKTKQQQQQQTTESKQVAADRDGEMNGIEILKAWWASGVEMQNNLELLE